MSTVRAVEPASPTATTQRRSELPRVRRAAPTATVERIPVLDADPGLGEGLDGESLVEASALATAPAWSLPRGRWMPVTQIRDLRGGLGLLIIDGLIARHMSLGVLETVEILGPGDVVRPVMFAASDGTPRLGERWTVATRAKLAVLDRSFMVAISPWPEITANLADRAALRVHRMALSAAIHGVRRVDERLLSTFWCYADRWGRVTPEGVVLDLHLTHRLLAALVGARRPSVTLALKALQEDGALSRRRDQSWLLHGERPRWLAPAAMRTLGERPAPHVRSISDALAARRPGITPLPR